MTKTSIRVACIQINAGADCEQNRETLLKCLRRAVRGKPDLLALPENFYWRGPEENLSYAFRSGLRFIRELRDWARRNRVAILLGSILEKSTLSEHYFNTSYLIGPGGDIRARYRKIHLFDVHLGNVKTQESRHILPGRKIVSARFSGTRVGLTICYDLRFPELFRKLMGQGVELVFVPANFTYATGRAHWEVLIRARAIENQMFVVAPAQFGIHPASGIRSFGTSLIVSPWGQVLAKASRDQEEILVQDLDLKLLRDLRNAMPSLRHQRLL